MITSASGFQERCLARFTALERRVILRTFDGDARNVCELLDEVLMDWRGRFGLVVIDPKRAQDLPGRRCERR